MTRNINQAKADNPAEIYNQKRRIIFSTHQSDKNSARHYLEGYRQKLGPRGYAGLNAELTFYERHQRDFKLIPALDAADATDFAAVIDGQMHRIDVTTNLDYKRLKSYEPLQSQGEAYKIAVYDGSEFELVDVNFPFCEACGGRVLPTAILLGENHNRHGESLGNHDQLLVEICGTCGEYRVIERETTSGLFDFSYWYSELNELVREAKELGEPIPDLEKEIKAYAVSAMRYLTRRFDRMLVGIGAPHYQITNPQTADGDWQYHIEFKLPLVEAHLDESHSWDIADG